MKNIRRLSALTAVIASLATSPVAGQNLLHNASFDDIIPNPPLTTRLYSTGASMGAWKVSFGDVHLVCGNFWLGYDGNCSVDLDGSVRGWIQQDVATVIGDSYDLDFHFAANDYVSRGAPRTFEVWWGNAAGALARVGKFSYSAAPGSSLTHLTWALGQIPGLHATSTLSRLQFRSTTPSAAYVGWGAVVDAVSLVGEVAAPPPPPPDVVPEPATLVLVGTGLGLAIGARRWRSRSRRGNQGGPGSPA